ncbi:hypothetical protein [Algoriphagus sp.]|uniref:hypothetical protein n=1 Tax=Algoriphagus sp. TaxID=1872435 RepID=UPI00329A5D50
MKNIFDPKVTQELIDRINSLAPETTPKWGKMSVDQMLAHCAVAYEMAYTDKHPKPNGLVRFLLKTFVKKGVVNESLIPKTPGPHLLLSLRIKGILRRRRTD